MKSDKGERGHIGTAVNLEPYRADLQEALEKLGQDDVVGRIWRKDHTLWNPEPTEISNRLGWLTVTDQMYQQLPVLEDFAREVRETGFTRVVLLGMGGSSLGAEVLRQTMGTARGYPELIVLDSTVPATVQTVTEAIDPKDTLFLVSSKSGTTTEPLILYRYFRSLVESAKTKEKAGQNFVAITDAGTPLARLAGEEGFRRTFLNPTDIGGRYSVLSYFGLVAAALTGIDLESLLKRADGMRQACASPLPTTENAGAWLGSCIGTAALKGRDKLTLIMSPGIGSLGLWIEQLIAESTGKEGKGIIPVVGEPLIEPVNYGSDRFFVHLRLKDDDNRATDAAVEGIRSSGQPLVVIGLHDRYDLGAEFFRWEFATAVAGARLGINPFIQPDVQQAKVNTERVLKEYVASGQLAEAETTGSLGDLLAGAETGKYLAIMAYLEQTPQVDNAINKLRQKVSERYWIATTFGYGPRYLHSTGQLHKGGPDKGLFLQLTAGHEKNLPIPGSPYTLATVADAQALGDFQALKALGHRVIRIQLDRDDGKAIQKLSDELD